MPETLTPVKENIQKWVDALESGEYSQDKDSLSTGEGFCCLGVACEVAMKNGLPLERCDNNPFDDASAGGHWYRSPDGGGSGIFLPEAVERWLGLHHNPTFRDPDADSSSEFTATQANDEEGWDFAKIARAIRATYLDE